MKEIKIDLIYYLGIIIFVAAIMYFVGYKQATLIEKPSCYNECYGKCVNYNADFFIKCVDNCWTAYFINYPIYTNYSNQSEIKKHYCDYCMNVG